VQQFGVGFENVDVDAATGLGVWVARIPGDADSVAELALLQLLAIVGRLDETREAPRNRRCHLTRTQTTGAGCPDRWPAPTRIHSGKITVSVRTA
jgi:lactate dehydrogenase-like 2-hydroxyacid dehydrogenase